MASAADHQFRVRDRDGSIGKQVTFLEAADTSKGLCQALRRDIGVGDGFVDGMNGGDNPVAILADQRHITACLDGKNCRVSDTIMIDDRVHLEVIR